MKSRRTTEVLWHAVGVVALVLATIAGTALAKNNSVDGVSPWWPPAGIGFAYLVLVGARGFVAALGARWIALWLVFDWDGSFLPRETITRSLGIVAVYTLAAVAYRRITEGRSERARLFAFIGAGLLVGPGLAGSVAELIRTDADPTSLDEFGAAVRTFWIGDAVAIASIAPFVILFVGRFRQDAQHLLDRTRTIRLGVVAEVVAMVVLPSLILVVGSTDRVEPRLALAVLPILWITFRHRRVVAFAGLLGVNMTTGFVAARVSSADELVEIQLLMLASAVAALIIGAELRMREDSLQQLRDSESRYRRLVDGAADLVVSFGDEGQPTVASRAIKFEHQDQVVEHITASWNSIRVDSVRIDEVHDHEWTLETAGGRRWYRTRFVEDPDQQPSIMSVTTELTDVRIAELNLAHARTHDNLTGLPDRSAAMAHLEAAGAELETEGGRLVVVHVGLDRFGSINQTHGLVRGDTILRLVAMRLADLVPDACCLARLGGDEFAIAGFLPGDASAAEALAESIVDLGRVPVVDGSISVTTTMSTGLLTTSDASVDPAELLRNAEVALNVAKELGGDQHVVSHPRLIRDAAIRSEILAGLRAAIGTDQMMFHYQPEVDLVSGHIIGYEALLRWNHPSRGLLLASQFIGIAEESRLIDEMTRPLIEAAIEQLARFGDVDGRELFMGINLAPTQLEDETLPDFVRHACGEHGVDPSRLRIEVTETTAMSEAGQAPEVLRQFRELGASVAIDDFGTGYASIGYLHRLPVNVLKIDRRYVTKIASDRHDRALVQMIVGLADGLDLTVIAEGVETPEQHDALVDLGCRRGQGYGLGRPTSGSQALALYQSQPAVQGVFDE